MSHKNLLIPALIAGSIATPLAAKPEIKDNPEIFSRLVTTAVANEIREKCSTIEARKWNATMYVLGILRYAKSQGFTQAEIEAYRDIRTEQDRLRAATYAYLDENGVDRSKPETHCPLGEKEIASGSQVGKLIKSLK